MATLVVTAVFEDHSNHLLPQQSNRQINILRGLNSQRLQRVFCNYTLNDMPTKLERKYCDQTKKRTKAHCEELDSVEYMICPVITTFLFNEKEVRIQC